MKEIFSNRRRAFGQQCAKYLKYVLNDHFVLFLMLGLGFILVQYSQLLRQLPKDKFFLQLFLVFMIGATSFLGDFNAYLERSDQLFLLAKEKELIGQVHAAKYRGFILWVGIQLMMLLMLYPLAKGVGISLWVFMVMAAVGMFIKWLVFETKAKSLVKAGQLKWDQALAHDRNQKQAILKFFSLFTQVKGVSQSVKRRSYLDNFLNLFPEKTWDYLFVRAFLRSGDYLTLSGRLTLLSLLSLIFVGNDAVATVLALLFNYLLLFQLLALYNHYNYQYLIRLFPLPLEVKKKSLRTFLNRLFLGLLVLEILAAVLYFEDKLYVMILLGAQLLFNAFYLPYKIAKLID